MKSTKRQRPKNPSIKTILQDQDQEKLAPTLWYKMSQDHMFLKGETTYISILLKYNKTENTLYQIHTFKTRPRRLSFLSVFILPRSAKAPALLAG